MNKELQRYYENRFDMMASPGWRDLMQDMSEMLSTTNKLDGVTVDNLKFKQGELSIIRWLMSLEQVSSKAYEDLNADNERL